MSLPTSNGFGLMVEGLVAVLLLLTIVFCIVLNKRLKKLRADEQALKATIAELITATEIAERAVAGLKVTVRDCDENLGARLRAGEALADELGQQMESGQQILAQFAQITLAARAPHVQPVPVAPPQPMHDAQATAQAAAAFAARSRHRLNQAA
jgi:branched-subunit amino acid permease